MDKLLEKDYVIRIIAVIIAVLLWFQASNEQNPTTERTFENVTVRLQNVEQGLTTVGDIDPATVRIKLSGPQQYLSSLATRDLNVYIDLADLEEGTHSIPIKVMEPTGTRLLDISSSAAAVTLEPIVRKRFAVSIIQQGLPALGHSVVGVSFDPVEVNIEGAASIINSIKNAAVVVDINNITSSFTRNVAVNVFDENGSVVRNVVISPENVNVSIEMVQAQEEKVVNIIPSLAGNPAAGYEILEVILEPLKVKVTGPLSIIDDLESVNTQTIEISGASQDMTVSVGLQLPTGIALVDATTFMVTIRFREVETTE